MVQSQSVCQSRTFELYKKKKHNMYNYFFFTVILKKNVPEKHLVVKFKYLFRDENKK